MWEGFGECFTEARAEHHNKLPTKKTAVSIRIAYQAAHWVPGKIVFLSKNDLPRCLGCPPIHSRVVATRDVLAEAAKYLSGRASVWA